MHFTGWQGGVASSDNFADDVDDDDGEAARGSGGNDEDNNDAYDETDDEDTDEARIEADEYHVAVEAVPVPVALDLIVHV